MTGQTTQAEPGDLSENKAAIAKMTLADCDKEFDKVAVAEIEITKIAAKYEADIARLKAKAAELIAPHKKCRDEAWEKVASFIVINGEKFKDPRSKKTLYGSYGLRAGKPSVEIVDQDKLVEFADRHQLDLYTREIKIDKTAVKAELEKGKVPGATLKAAQDEIFGKVEKRLIDEAKKSATKAA